MDLVQESVHGVIFSEDKQAVLLVKRKDVPVWVLPGGGIERGETAQQAMEREVEEETGYRVATLRKIAEYTPISRLATYTHVYECAIESGVPTLSDETAAIEFFPLTALPQLIPPPYPDWIADATLFLPAVLQKKMKGVTYISLLKHALVHPYLVARFLFIRARRKRKKPLK